jgi:hypothetical protein
MSMFMVDPAKLRNDAEKKLKIAEGLRDAAEDTHHNFPTRDNLISLKAAQRLVKETEAEYREWDDA